VASALLAALALAYDIYSDFKYQMFPRSGALITCFSVLIPLIRFQYAEAVSDLDKVTDQLLRHHGIATADEVVARRFLRVSRTSNFALAILGTLIWAFGDFAKGAFVQEPASVSSHSVHLPGSATAGKAFKIDN
jgi:hypothetical protein